MFEDLLEFESNGYNQVIEGDVSPLYISACRYPSSTQCPLFIAAGDRRTTSAQESKRSSPTTCAYPGLVELYLFQFGRPPLCIARSKDQQWRRDKEPHVMILRSLNCSTHIPPFLTRPVAGGKCRWGALDSKPYHYLLW